MSMNSSLARHIGLIYGLSSYALFLVVFLYAAGFVGNIWVPKGIDSNPGQPFVVALAIDLGLLGLFALQHSGMARPAFKRWLAGWLPRPLERSTYVLFSSLALLLLFWLWEPLGGQVWKLDSSAARWGMTALGIGGWLLVLASTFLIHHFDLFGLRQVGLYWLGREYTPLPFRTPSLYRYVRHPLYVGWLLAFWCTPTMTLSHLCFAVVTTAYILAAIRWEERDLMQVHPEYASYRKRVPALLPRFRRSA